MVDIPILILMGVVAPITVVLLGLGYVYRTSFPMSFMWFLSGAIFLLIFLTTDAIALSYENTSIVTNTNDISQPYNVNGSNAMSQIGGTSKVVGEFIPDSNSALYLDIIDCMTIQLSEVTAQTALGDITFGVFYNDTMTLKKEFGTLDASLLPTNKRTFYTFCLDSGDIYQIQALDNIGVFYNATSGSPVNIYVDNTNPFDGTNTYRRTINTGGFSDSTSQDITGFLYLRGIETETKTFEPIRYDIKVTDSEGNYTAEPTFIGIMLLMLSLCFIMIGILIEKFN